MTAEQIYAALILRHLRAGAYDTAPSTVVARFAQVIAQGFARLRSAAEVLAEDVTPASESTARALLPDWEATVGEAARGSVAERQVAVIGRLRDSATPTVQELRDALEAILGYEPTIHEQRQADLPPERAELVFQFVVELTEGWPDARTERRVRTKLESLKPAHTDYLLTDDVDWIVGRGVVGRTVI